MRIQLTIQALLPGDTTPLTTTAYLGKDSVNHLESVVLTPLFKAGDMTGVLRFGRRDEPIGGDSWGTAVANELIKAAPSLIIFNDLSMEHGGVFPPHLEHNVGRAIDARYPGPGGESNALNGSGDNPNIKPNPPHVRRDRWAQAEGGDVNAQREMVQWLRTVRTNMDAIFGAGLVQRILVGREPWNWAPILNGKYAGGAAIVDPDTHQPLGAWSPRGTVTPASDHLDHIHIEVKPRSAVTQ
jgi:hypothetical protein